jgi:hypothetical protein
MTFCERQRLKKLNKQHTAQQKMKSAMPLQLMKWLEGA